MGYFYERPPAVEACVFRDDKDASSVYLLLQGAEDIRVVKEWGKLRTLPRLEFRHNGKHHVAYEGDYVVRKPDGTIETMEQKDFAKKYMILTENHFD